MPLIRIGKTQKVLERSDQDFRPGAGTTFSAVFEDAMMHNPTQAVQRQVEISSLADKTEGIKGVGTDDFSRVGDTFGFTNAQAERNKQEFAQRMESNDAWISRDHALDWIKEKGFSEKEIPISSIGANRFVLNQILVQKEAERKREFIIQRGSQGRTMLTLSAGLAGSVTDPLGLAAGFIPFFGQARYMRALQAAGPSKFSTAMVRMRYGAAEGLAGSVLTEPMVASASQTDLLHYTAEDSLANIAFGTVLGSGMHMGFGYLSDVARGTPAGSGLELNPNASSRMGEAIQNQVPNELRQGALVEAINAGVHNKNLTVQQYLRMFDIEIDPRRRLSLPDGIRMDIDEVNRLAMFDSTGNKLDLDNILSRTDLPESFRKIARNSEDIEDFAEAVQGILAKQEGLELQINQDIRKALGKNADKTLTQTAPEGIKLTDKQRAAAKKAGIDVDNNALFKNGKKPLGTFIKESKEAGYDITANNAWNKIARDLEHGTELTAKAREIMDANIKDLDSLLSAGRRAKEGGDNTLRGYSEAFESDTNLRSYNEGRQAELEEISGRTEETETSYLEQQITDLEEMIELNRADTGIGVNRVESDKIDADAKTQTDSVDRLVSCLMEGV